MLFKTLTDFVAPLSHSALNVAFHSAALLAEWVPSVSNRMDNCRLVENRPYAGPDSAREQHLDILLPLTPGPYPIIVYIHGGAFTTCSKRSHRALASTYASLGYLVFNIDYRLAPRHHFPAALEDAIAAYEWVVDNAEKYHGDLARIAVAGESAGANLALGVTLSAYTSRDEAFAKRLSQCRAKPIAALLYCGFLQVSEPERYGNKGAGLTEFVVRDIGRSYLGSLESQQASCTALADPLCIVENLPPGISLPPIFIATGTADPLLDDSKRLSAALRRHDLPHVAEFYSDEHHVFHLMFWRSNALQCWTDTFFFLDQHVTSPNDIATR